jgi:hypothetical protein
MKSIIIQHKENKDITLSKITLLANQLNIHSQLELTLLYTIHKIYKNNPLQNNSKTQQNIRLDIIQIIQQHANNQQFVKKEPTISAINNAIWKLTKAGGLIDIDGLYVLNSCFKDIDLVDQIVFRFNNAIEDK